MGKEKAYLRRQLRKDEKPRKTREYLRKFLFRGTCSGSEPKAHFVFHTPERKPNWLLGAKRKPFVKLFKLPPQVRLLS